jgi:glyoxalase family protein
MTNERILGIHHMTAITDDAQANVDFYTGVLGLRLVKLTVNFDDPNAYHLYYGDGIGTPGSALTFFPYQGRKGKIGAGQVTATGLAIPTDSMGWWIDRFTKEGVNFEKPTKRGDEEVLAFQAHDGLPLELVASPDYTPGESYSGSPVPAEHSIGRMHSITITENYGEATLKLITEVLGFEPVKDEGSRIRLQGSKKGPGAYLDLVIDPAAPNGHGGFGGVHHIAWATEDVATQLGWREKIEGLGYHISPVMNRDYFKSIYFREPGGVLFEIATLGPGMLIDEDPVTLGTSLRLPQMYEPIRQQIERTVPKLRLPNGVWVPIEMAVAGETK